MKLTKKAIVVHSGGMDSSICLAIAKKQYGAEGVLSLSFNYQQRHSIELQAAQKICTDWGVDHVVLDIGCLQQITHNALMDSSLEIVHEKGDTPNTLVLGRNGLMARLAAIHAHSLGAEKIFMGIMELESANSGYRDCSRHYMDKMQEILRLDLDSKTFVIETPLVRLTKLESLYLADELGVLVYLLETTISCYRGVPKEGCQSCPACRLRNRAILDFSGEKKGFELSYLSKIF